MSRDKTIKFLRTTKSNLDTQKAGNNLIEGEPYLITDEGRLAIGTGVGSYSEMAKKSEVDSKKSDSVSATSRVLGRKTAGSGVIEELTVDEVLAFLSDNTSGDVSTSKHGLVPKAPNDTTKFLRGDGTWDVPAGGSTPTLKLRTALLNVSSLMDWGNVTGMSVAVSANKKYLVIYALYGYSSNNGGLLLRFNCSQANYLMGSGFYSEDASYYNSSAWTTSTRRIGTNFIVNGGETNFKYTIGGSLLVEMSTQSGTLYLQAMNAGQTGNCYVDSGSYFVIMEVS